MTYKCNLFDKSILEDYSDAVAFISSILQASTEYSIIAQNLDGTILLWNEGAKRIYGYDPEEVIGKSNTEILYDPAFLATNAYKEIKQTTLKLGKWEGIVRRQRKNREFFSARVVITPRLNQAGIPFGFLIISKDLTHEMRLLEREKESENYAKALIKAYIQPFAVLDLSGKMTDLNAAMLALTGYTEEELIGQPLQQFFTDPHLINEGITRTLQDGKVVDLECICQSKNGEQHFTLFQGALYYDNQNTLRGIFVSFMNISEQKAKEAKLYNRAAYYRSLIESSVDAFIIIDCKGLITDVNPQVCRISGYTRDELISTPFERYFLNPEKAIEYFRKTLAEGTSKDSELTLKTKSGISLMTSVNASVFYSIDGRIEGVFACARDFSQQYLLQKNVLEQQVYMRSLIEASPDGLFTIDLKGHILDVNQGALDLTGYTQKHLINSSFSSYFVDAVHANESLQWAISEKRVINIELTLIKRQGDQINVSFNAGLFTDDLGNPKGVFAILRDITPQKTLEMQLKTAQLYTRSLIEANIEPLVTTDPLGNITDINHQMEILTGYERKELIGTPFKNYVTDPMRAEKGIAQVLKNGKITNYEVVIRSKNGTETVVSYNATIFFDQNHRLQGLFASARDMTAIKHYEKKLQEKNRELELASQAKDRFLSMMSHELRTPLTSILGFTSILLTKEPGPLTDDQEKQLISVHMSGQRLLSLVNDLLDVTRIESGKVLINTTLVDINTLIKELVDELKPLAEKKGIQFNYVHPSKKITLNTDKRALSQIIINLANNAIKFTERGEIEIKVSEESIEGQPSLAIHFIDTGIGISKLDQERLFQAFERIDTPIRNVGTGLGLYLSQKLALLLNGHIECTSEIGKGSTFSLIIPKQ